MSQEDRTVLDVHHWPRLAFTTCITGWWLVRQFVNFQTRLVDFHLPEVTSGKSKHVVLVVFQTAGILEADVESVLHSLILPRTSGGGVVVRIEETLTPFDSLTYSQEELTVEEDAAALAKASHTSSCVFAVR